jgi:hypothetical protein
MVVIARDTKLPIARAAAIDAHANFEQALFTLFASLLGAPRDRAGIVFFRIASAPTRNKILESLLKKTHEISTRSIGTDANRRLRTDYSPSSDN